MVNYKRTTDTTYEVNKFNQRLFYKSIFHDNHLCELSDHIALNPILLNQLIMESPRFNTDVQCSLSTCLMDVSDSFLSVMLSVISESCLWPFLFHFSFMEILERTGAILSRSV